MKKATATVALWVLLGTAHAAAPNRADMQKIDDALARSVVDRIVVDVARLRGLKFTQPVPVSVVSDDEAMAQHMQRMQEQGDLEELRDQEIVLKLLGLANPDEDVLELLTDALREQIGGYYDPVTGEFYLLDDMPAALVDVLTAHELTHALEDQHFELDTLLEADDVSDDALFARASVIEGSATLLMTIYSVELAVAQQLSDGALETMSAVGEEALDKLPMALVRQMLAPYILGMAFVQRGNALGWMAQGLPVADLNALYAAPPLSSEQILHPEKYWDSEQRDDPIHVDLGSSGEQLGRGWERRIEGVLGELDLALLVGALTPKPDDPRAMQGVAWTHRAASGWGGDRFELWVRGKKSVLLLSTVWDSDGDAQEFSAAVEKRTSALVKLDGSRVALLFGDTPRKSRVVLLDEMLRHAPQP